MDCVIHSMDWRTSLVFINLHVSNVNLKATIDPQIGRVRLSLISLYSSLKDFRSFFLSSIHSLIIYLLRQDTEFAHVCCVVFDGWTLHQHKKLRWLLLSASRSVFTTLFSKQSSFIISFTFNYLERSLKLLEVFKTNRF